MIIRDYVEKQFENYPSSEEKQNIIEELVSNMSEKVEDLVAAGKGREDAINKVIVDFGDINELKGELKKHGTNLEIKLKARFWFALWGCLMIIAVCMFTNYYFTPKTIWYPFVIFGVIWWPMRQLYVMVIYKKED